MRKCLADEFQLALHDKFICQKVEDLELRIMSMIIFTTLHVDGQSVGTVIVTYVADDCRFFRDGRVID